VSLRVDEILTGTLMSKLTSSCVRVTEALLQAVDKARARVRWKGVTRGFT